MNSAQKYSFTYFRRYLSTRYLVVYDYGIGSYVYLLVSMLNTLEVYGNLLKLNVKHLNNNNNNNDKYSLFSFKKLFLNNKCNIYLGAFEIILKSGFWMIFFSNQKGNPKTDLNLET